MKKYLLLFFTFFAAFAYANSDTCVLLDNMSFNNSTTQFLSTAYNDGHLYKIRAKDSTVGFCINTSIGRIESSFSEFIGGVLVKENAKPIVMVVDTASLTSNNFLATGVLTSESLFDIETHPTLTFEGTDIVWKTNTIGYVDGILTIRNIQKSLRLNVELKEYSTTHITIVANATIDRTEFGMKAFQGLAGNKVNLCMNIVATVIK